MSVLPPTPLSDQLSPFTATDDRPGLKFINIAYVENLRHRSWAYPEEVLGVLRPQIQDKFSLSWMEYEHVRART